MKCCHLEAEFLDHDLLGLLVDQMRFVFRVSGAGVALTKSRGLEVDDHYFTKICSGSEAGRLIDFCITQI